MPSLPSNSIPKVLVCFFVYNEATKILQAINQIKKQSYPYVEVAIFDNCSADGTIELIEGLKDSRLVLFKNSENQGSFKNFLRARSYAISRKHCDYFLLADVDDWYHENYLQNLVALLEKNPRAVGAIPSVIIKYTDIHEIVFWEQRCTYELLNKKNLRFFKAFQIMNKPHLQYCMLIRSLLRRSYLDILFSEDTLFFGLEEFISVLGLYLGGIVTTPSVQHIKYQVHAPPEARQIDGIVDFSSFAKRWQVFVFDVSYTINLSQLNLFEKVQIIFLVFYRIFILYNWVNFVKKIKTSKNPLARLIVMTYQPIKVMKNLVGGGR